MNNNNNNNVPPPPQAGKFKPRKPAKSTTTNRVVVPEHVPSTHVPSQPRTSSTAAGRGGRGSHHHGQHSRGSGSRGGRPNMSTPIVQGQAFFTAPPVVGRGRLQNNNNMPLAVTSNAAATTTIGPPQRPSRRKRDDPHNQTGGDEEIVGTLDEAVGYNALNVSSSSSQQNRSNVLSTSAVASDVQKAERVLGKLTSPYTHGPNGTMYDDSDSSDDEQNNNNNHHHEMDDIIVETRQLGVPRPLTLPFPHHHRHPVATAPVDTTPTTNLQDPDTTTTTVPPPQCQQFPFWNTNDHAYCLVQLPTRLPPVIAAEPVVASTPMDPEVRMVDAPTVVTTTPPGFDQEVLLQAPPGRMGTLKVYRSGRTVLVLESHNNLHDAAEEHDTTATHPVRTQCDMHMLFFSEM